MQLDAIGFWGTPCSDKPICSSFIIIWFNLGDHVTAACVSETICWRCVRDIFHCWNMLKPYAAAVITNYPIESCCHPSDPSRQGGLVYQVSPCEDHIFSPETMFSSVMFSLRGWCSRGSTCNMWMFPRTKGGPEAKLSLGEKAVSKRWIATFIQVLLWTLRRL